MKSKFYVTTPIYYVNDAPHIGHAYTTILADVLTRFHRMQGVPSFFLTGTDEHGQKVKRAAEKAGLTPKEQADKTVVRFQKLWEKLYISNDDFIRTTEERHIKVVQTLLKRLYDKGEIYKSEYDGWYCVPCERFFTERDAQAGTCLECGRKLEKIKESNYFFRMSAYQEWLIQYIKEHPGFILPEYRRNETLGFLQKPLGDLCISRPKTRLDWGIELPFDKDYVTYVWFDALINYISAVGCCYDEEKFHKWWPATYHLIGKDILTTHTVYWPIMLKAMDIPMPECVFAHGWWLVGESKMSKSVGNVVNPMEMADKYGVDAFRYFLMAEMSLGQDCNFSEEAFIRRYNADLANDIGNLLSRTTKLIYSHCDGCIPAVEMQPVEEEEILKKSVLEAISLLEESIDNMRIDQGLAAIGTAIREANRYLEKRQPWTLAKENKKNLLHTTLYYAAETLRITSSLLEPVMPKKMIELKQTLGIANEEIKYEDIKQWGKLKAGTKLGKSTILFPRITNMAELKYDVHKEQEKCDASYITYEEFSKVKLVVARIIEAERIAGADKLLKLKIDIGNEQRQIVAGIALHYAPEALIGKQIVVVANLKPAKIRGIESNGMLLAASSGDKLHLITVDGEAISGSSVR